MKVFISWSGDLSRKVALVFREWLPSVIQAMEPYVSSEDIDKGARWSTDIAKELEASCYGILCVTPQNIDAPWLNFEAGALSKTIDKSRVCPFLFGLKRSEVRDGPLLQFQSTIYEYDDVAKLLHSLNNAGESRCIEEARLDSVLKVWWSQLQERLDHLLPEAAAPTTNEKKTKSAKGTGEQSEILEELLELTRNQQKLLNSPEAILPPAYLDHVFSRYRRYRDRDGINPAAIADLERSWESARAAATKALRAESDDDNPRLLAELISLMEPPIRYILRTEKHRPRFLGDGPEIRSSAPPKVLSDPSASERVPNAGDDPDGTEKGK
jgi:hypothetical protein